MTDHTDDLAAKVHAAWIEARKGCWCAGHRKPCTYHEGMLDGTDLAAAVFLARITELEGASEAHCEDHQRDIEEYERRLDALKAKSERLRDALDRLATFVPKPGRDAWICNDMQDIARAALDPIVHDETETCMTCDHSYSDHSQIWHEENTGWCGNGCGIRGCDCDDYRDVPWI